MSILFSIVQVYAKHFADIARSKDNAVVPLSALTRVIKINNETFGCTRFDDSFANDDDEKTN